MKCKYSLIISCFACISLVFSNPVKVITVPEKADTDYRLDTNVVPILYNVELSIPINFQVSKDFTNVKTVITLNVKAVVPEFSLHYQLVKDGYKEKVKLTKGDEDIPLSEPTYNEETAKLTIKRLDEVDFEVGNDYSLEFSDIKGALQNDMHGLYMSTYKVGDDVKYALSTQFQTTHARKVFPCFDEPSFKAKFTFKLNVPDIYTATLSNEQGTGGAPSGGMTTYTFEETPTMSTYLIAFLVSHFKSTAATGDSNVQVYFPEKFEGSAAYAVQKTLEIRNSLKDFTGIDYAALGITKLRQIAVPDFSAGAMENWGLATYRERGLLWNAAESSTSQKEYILSIIGHELAHFWFGDYVTCEWWSETWLNEGFATYFASMSAAVVDPKMKMMEQFVVDTLQPVLIADASPNSLPLTSDPTDVNTYAQISAKFGDVTYSKGGLVIRMMEHFMPEKKFMDGLKTYLDVNKYDSVTPNKLWTELNKQIAGVTTLPDTDMANIMDEWTNKPGFPLITVKRVDNNAVFSQKRFLSTPATTPDTTKWFVPITYATSTHNADFANTKDSEWLLKTEDLTIEDAFTDTDTWIVANVQQTGFYRVDYDGDLWEEIRKALRNDNFGGIHVLNRAQIIDDLLNIARVESDRYKTAMDVSKYLEKETDYLPWVSAFNAFAFIRRRVSESDESYTQLNKYLLKITKELYKSVVEEPSSELDHMDNLKWALAYRWACDLGDNECTQMATAKFKEYVATPEVNPIPTDMRSVVYCNALRQGSKDDFDFLWERFTKAEMSTEQVTIIGALGCTTNEDAIKSLMGNTLSSASIIRKHDQNSVITSILNGKQKNAQTLLAYLDEDFEEVNKDADAMKRILTSIADRMTTNADVEKLTSFATNHVEYGELITELKKSVAGNIEWSQSYRDNNLGWLRTENSAASITVSFAAVLLALVSYYVA